MFCGRCGNPMDDNAMFCPNCGAAAENETPVEEPAAPVEEAAGCVENEQATAESDISAQEENQSFAESEYPAFDLNTEGEVVQSKKKISKVPFLIGGIVVVIAAVLLAVFNWANVSGFFVRTFSSPEKLQTKVYENVVSRTFDKLTVSEKAQKDAAVDPANMGAETEVRLNIDEQLLSLIPTQGMDISWLSDIAIGYDVSVKDKMEKVAMDLILGDTTIVSADTIFNLESMEAFVSIPDLNDQAIYMDVSAMFEDMYGSYMSLYDPENLEMLAEIIPSQEVLERILTRYVGVVMSGFGDVEKSSEKVKVSGVSQKLHVLKATMDEDDLIEIAENLLKTLKKDDDIEDIILKVEEISEQEGLYDSFLEAMDDALESLEDVEPDDIGSFKITLVTYLNDANEIVGNTVKLSLSSLGMGMKYEPISWVRVEQGKKFASELVISAGTESIVFEGKGENGKTKNGEYVLSYDGNEILTVKLKDYISNDDQFAGTIRIAPSEDAMENIMDEADLSQSIIDLIGTAEPALEIKFDSNTQGGSFSIALAVGSKNLIAISSNTKLTTPDDIVIPENYVEITADSDGSEWLENMNPDFLDTLMDRLIEAGVPAELFAFN